MVYMFLANGFEEIEALCPLDLLRRANIEVTTVGIGSEVIGGAHNITVHADIVDVMFSDSNPEMIILPGGMPGAKNLDESRIVDTAIKIANKKGAYIAAICAAPFILGKRGLLKGKRAVCYPGFEGELIGAKVGEEGLRVITDGAITTAVGMGAAGEFALALLCAMGRKKEADALAKAAFLQ